MKNNPLIEVLKEAEDAYRMRCSVQGINYDETMICGPKALADQLEKWRIEFVASYIIDALNNGRLKITKKARG